MMLEYCISIRKTIISPPTEHALFSTRNTTGEDKTENINRENNVTQSSSFSSLMSQGDAVRMRR